MSLIRSPRWASVRFGSSGNFITPWSHERRLNIPASITQTNFWLRFVPAFAGRDHSRRAGGTRCVCLVADWWWEVAALSIACAGSAGVDGGCFAVDLFDEGSG